MENTKETIPANSSSRRKFVWGVASLSLFTAVAAAFKLPFTVKKTPVVCKSDGIKKTIKMLTEDGRLVEVDEALLTTTRKKVTRDELKHWIKNSR